MVMVQNIKCENDRNNFTGKGGKFEDESGLLVVIIYNPVTSSIARETSLNAYLRYTLALPGTKSMCREGGCGACIVTVRARRQTSHAVESFSVNSVSKQTDG